jgi:threonine aldolase
MAANCLALSVLAPRHGAVFAHEDAHVLAHESTAPELFSQARFVPVAGRNGRIDPAALRAAIARFTRGDVHAPQPAVLTLTQATEVGTLYSPGEIAVLAAIAHENGMAVHMDGARIANAVAALGVSPADITWRAGVDVLSLGLTKTGALNAEAVVFFDPASARDIAFQRKRTGHLVSKMRFLSAQIAAMLEGDLWLSLATQANAQAAALARALAHVPGVTLDIAQETNAVFPLLPQGMANHLETRGALFYAWGPPEADGRQRIRLVTSFSTSPSDIERFVNAARAFASG